MLRGSRRPLAALSLESLFTGAGKEFPMDTTKTTNWQEIVFCSRRKQGDEENKLRPQNSGLENTVFYEGIRLTVLMGWNVDVKVHCQKKKLGKEVIVTEFSIYGDYLDSLTGNFLVGLAL